MKKPTCTNDALEAIAEHADYARKATAKTTRFAQGEYEWREPREDVVHLCEAIDLLRDLIKHILSTRPYRSGDEETTAQSDKPSASEDAAELFRGREMRIRVRHIADKLTQDVAYGPSSQDAQRFKKALYAATEGLVVESSQDQKDKLIANLSQVQSKYFEVLEALGCLQMPSEAPKLARQLLMASAKQGDQGVQANAFSNLLKVSRSLLTSMAGGHAPSANWAEFANALSLCREVGL